MKTPEEIKKGLAHCAIGECDGCPYADDCVVAFGITAGAMDALEYIQQLEGSGDLIKPAVDAKRRGEWEPVLVQRHDKKTISYYACSLCGQILGNPFNYCPCCGALMGGDDT